MMVADAEVPTPLRTGRRTQGDQSLLPANHAVPRDTQVRTHVIPVGHVEADAVDADVGAPRIGDGEMDVAQVTAVQPGNLAAEIITQKLPSATVIDLGPEQFLNASK